MKFTYTPTPGDLLLAAKAAERAAEAGYAKAYEAGADLTTRGRYTDLSNRALAVQRQMEYPGKVEDDWAGIE